MINIEQAVTEKFPGFANQSWLIRTPTISLLKRLVHENQINDFLKEHNDATGVEFIDRVFDYFDFSYSVTARDRANIPATGRVVIIANHPIGSLDGLAILRLITEVRQDVKIVANDMLMNFEALHELFIPLDNMGNGSARRSYKRVIEALKQEQAIIIFPAGEVSRARPTGVRDTRWRPGFLHFARKAEAPILPIHIRAKNSFLFYGASMVFKGLGTALLAREMFNKQSRTINFNVGEMIPAQSLESKNLHDRTLVKRLKKHLYKIGRKKRPIFETEKTIAHPENPQQLLDELNQAELLGKTRDNNRIYLFDHKPNSAVIREIGRLRELTFRQVGEGTGKKRDLDVYDCNYRHLVLWDNENLEIAGAYRIGEGASLLKQYGEKGFYTHSLYDFKPEFRPYLENCIELGRSFVNPKYWGKASLDYLWQGIGAYLAAHPNVRYIIGPVSMSATYPKELMDILAYFYTRYYAFPTQVAAAHNPYKMSADVRTALDNNFADKDKDEALDYVQERFRELGHKLPVLFKQYTALFEHGGFQSLVFSIDPDFGDCLDGLCIADLSMLKENKRKRYIPLEQAEAA